jgi:anaerobic glycerol-3-phosphate dehydrogenase C subunit
MTSLEKDLKKIIKGGILFDDIARHIYSSGASIYGIKPKGVVLPKDKDDVIAIVKYAGENNIPLTPRGACTSLAGQAVGSGIIIDFTKYMNRVIDYDGGRYVRVEPGLVYGGLNKYLSKFGKFFPPDPSSGGYCTIGGMIADNSGGPHSVKYGNTANWCEGLEVVLSTGEPVRLRQGSKVKSLSEPLSRLFIDNKENITKYAPKVNRNASGYNIYDAMKDGFPDLVKLIVGSEGTLAIITEATLKLADPPKFRAVILLFLKDMNGLTGVISELQELKPAAVEFMDETFIKLARDVEPKLKDMLPAGSKGVFLVEFEEEGRASCDEKIASLKQRLMEERALISGLNIAQTPEEQERLWDVRRAAVPIMNRIKGKKRPIPFIEDAIVPPERLDEFVAGAYAIFNKYSVDACVYGHAGDGNMHIRPLIDMKDKAGLIKMNNMADDFYGMVLSLGGSASAEHGDGILRIPYLKKQFGPLYAMFTRIKDIFDPKGILNPGKKIGKDDSITHDLIYDPQTAYYKTDTVLDSAQARAEIEKCHACGLCRTVCPVNINLPEEIASPRAKAAIFKAFINGQLDKSLLSGPPVKEALDLCVNCKSCRIECPTGADVPLLCSLAKENYVKQAGIPLPQALLENMYLLGSISGKSPGFYGALSSSPAGKSLTELLIGIDKRRPLPKPSVPPFEKKRFSREKGKRQVAYFYGCYVNFFNAESEGSSVMKVLRKNGIGVILPKQKCCGIPSVSSGNIKAVKKDMAYNLKQLYDAVGAGCDIITSCPSCGLAIKEDYPRILNTSEAAAVSQKTFDIHEYLWLLFNEGTLNVDFKPSGKKAVFHAPCHLKAQGISGLQERLSGLIPRISISKITDSCCGMAGSFGLKKKNFDLSMAIGERLFSNIKDASADFVVTSCGACKTQIKQGSGCNVIHLVELLAEYYS